MITSSSSTFESIEKLLQFQNSFLNLVHSQVLTHQQGDRRKQALLKFQVLEISQKNEIFNEIITTLKRELIDEKLECDSVLKSYFLKLLELDYLPLLHVNRYELTKLSIFGFDIYIDPLQAILQVLNRLQRILYILEDSLTKDNNLSQTIKQLARQKKSISQILLCGWKEYYSFLQLNKLSLNIYMLKQYINIAITSLPKKDKEIIFTGVYNIYKRLIPILNQHYLISILQQLSDLNNMMYNFHGSFDYFMFFTYIQPIQQNVGVYSRISEIQKKCSHTNILTPLLFGVMNNYKAFVRFIQIIQSSKYVHLLRTLLSGLIINFKLRILQYNEVLQLIGFTINKLCLLNKMKLSIITGELAKEWKQAKQFFISAFKSGYNPGEIQTWTLCDSNVIQPTIITFLIKGLLLSENYRNDEFLRTLQKNELEQVLESQLKQLTDGTQTVNGLMNNWKQLTIINEKNEKKRQNQQRQIGQNKDQVSTSNKETETKNRQLKLLNLVRIINLMSMLQITSQRLVYAIVNVFNTLGITNSTKTNTPTNYNNSLTYHRLHQSIQTLNQIITTINRKQSLSNLKDILPLFHLTYPPRRTFQDIVPVYLHSFISRQAVYNLVSLVGVYDIQEGERILRTKQVLTAIVHKYFTKCEYLKQQQDKVILFELYKSFDKQYKLPSFAFNIDLQSNSIFSNLVKIFTTSEQQSLTNKSNNNNKIEQITSQILLNLLKHSPQHIIAVLNLPVSCNQTISTFLNYLINSLNQKNKDFIIKAIQLFNQFVVLNNNQTLYDLKTYLYESYYLTVLDSVLLSISTAIQKQNWCQNQYNINKTLSLIDLFVRIYETIIVKNQEHKNQQTIQSVLSPVWTNLSQLLSYLMKNSQYSTETIINACKLYWKLLHITKGNNNINAWYHKLALNRIFSTLTTQNLLFSQSFKGITLISSIKNYYISKQNNGDKQNSTHRTNQNVKRYSFADIKTFFQNNYVANSIKKNNDELSKQENKDLYLSQFLLLIQSAKNQSNSIKTQIHITSDKQMPPCLSEQKMQKLYNQYCNQTLSEQQKAHLQFCLLLLVLNPVNHRNLWKIIMKSENKVFLQHMSFTRQTINEVLQVLQVLENKNNQKEKFQAQQKCPKNTFHQQITSMLGLQLLKNNVNQLQLLASAFYFNTTKLQTFLKHKQVLWFLIVLNNSSWREFNEIFSTHLKNTCFLSSLLQYKEYLSITHQANNDYEKNVEDFSLLIDQYLFYVQKKLNSIELLKTIDSKKENQIRKSTLLINIKVLLLKCEMQKILQKVKIIVKELHQNSLSDLKFRNFLQSLHNLNKICNNLLNGNIKLPDFVHHNSYTTAENEQKQFSFGVWIQDCEKVFQHQELQKSQFSYIPSLDIFQKKNNLQDFFSVDKQNDIVFRRVLDSQVDKVSIQKEYEKLKQNLKDYIQSQTENISLRHQNCVDLPKNLLNDFYCLGYLHFEVINQQNTQNNNQNLSLLLESLVNRQRIPLEVIKQIDASAYHHLKLLIINDKIQLQKTKSQQQTEKNLQVTSTQQKQSQRVTFVWNDKQLIPKGKQIIVNDQNKNLYIQLIAEQILEKPYIELNNAFALGYLNASFVHKNE